MLFAMADSGTPPFVPAFAHGDPANAVLVIDGDEKVREQASRLLERGGYAPRCVARAREALQALRSGHYFAILVDMLMPDMDGLELLRIVRREHPDVSVIAMTGAPGPLDYLDIALKLGADDGLRKPFDALQLAEVVARQQCLRQTRRGEERRYVRVPVTLEGHILDATSSAAHPCKVLNVSAGGALIACATDLRDDGKHILFMEHFGRFEVRIAHRRADNYGLQFVMGELKRKRLMERMSSYMAGGADSIARLRQFPRARVQAEISAVRPGGQIIACSVIDISLDGASLNAETKPPIGEIVTVGKTQGRVVRHHDCGFAIQFIAALAGTGDHQALLDNESRKREG